MSAISFSPLCLAHGTVVDPASRVYRVYQSNPSNPNFALAQTAVALDGELSYYSWNELSRNIPEAVNAGLPPGFDYSSWIPDGELASAGRVDPNSPLYPRTYTGLDQVSTDWPTTAVAAGSVMPVDFLATASHSPSVWDVWMTTPSWDPSLPLTWDKMEFLGRPQVTLSGGHYQFDVTVPGDRDGHHVLWVAWQRDDPAGEVFISVSDLMVTGGGTLGTPYCVANGNSASAAGATITATGSTSIGVNDLSFVASPVPAGQFGLFFYGPVQAQVPLGDGILCVGGSLTRVRPIIAADPMGGLRTDVDLSGPNGAPIAPGGTHHFQAWFRDPAGGPAGSNLSTAVSIQFAQ